MYYVLASTSQPTLVAFGKVFFSFRYYTTIHTYTLDTVHLPNFGVAMRWSDRLCN